MKGGKKITRVVSVDERGRITLPKDARKETDTYAVEIEGNGSLRLVPQKAVTLEEAKILESLKRSVVQFKKGKTKAMPKEWIESQ